MNDATGLDRMPLEANTRITEAFRRERSRLLGFIRRRVRDPLDAEDVLQDVFYELAEANRLLVPIEHVTAWLFRVARNRIADLFRKKRPLLLSEIVGGENDERLIDDLLPSLAAGPEGELEQALLAEALERAIAELPAEQREVFVGHELEGRSFKEMAAASGTNVNTLLSRKRYAVLRLRERLQDFVDDFNHEEGDSR